MTSQHRARAVLAASLAIASLAAAAPAGADPNPAQRVQSNPHAGASAQEQYYMSHKPAIPAPGHDFRAIDAVTPVAAAAAGSSGFEWDDAAIGAGTALALALVCAGGATVVIRRHRGAATS